MSASAGSPLRDTSVIFIWLPGGPPHLETYDMKPEAPSEYRGIFKPIPTNVSGIEVCELLPLHAKIADKFNLIRSIHHEFADHGGGHKRFMTGRDPREPTGFVNDAPAVTSVVAKKLAPSTPDGLPTCVAGVDRGREATGPWRIPRAGWTDIALRVKDEWGSDHVGLAAAGVAFYAFLSLFPALVATVSILGLVSQGSDPSSVIDNLFGALPASARDVPKGVKVPS